MVLIDQLTEGRRVEPGGQARYRYDIAEAARDLWKREINADVFYGRMVVIIQEGLWRAWLQGAAQVGVTEEELTDEERIRAQEYVQEQLTYVPAFGEWLLWAGDVIRDERTGMMLPRVPVTGVLQRVTMWAEVYGHVLTEARLKASLDLKSRWIVGNTEHCIDCATMEGRVYRNSTWIRYNILPKVPELACGGFRCACRLEPTNDPITRGHPPALHGPG